MHEGLEGLSSQTLRHTHAGTHTYLLFSHDVFLSSSTQDYFQSFKVMILQKRSICLIKKEVQSDKNILFSVVLQSEKDVNALPKNYSQPKMNNFSIDCEFSHQKLCQ